MQGCLLVSSPEMSEWSVLVMACWQAKLKSAIFKARLKYVVMDEASVLKLMSLS